MSMSLHKSITHTVLAMIWTKPSQEKYISPSRRSRVCDRRIKQTLFFSKNKAQKYIFGATTIIKRPWCDTKELLLLISMITCNNQYPNIQILDPVRCFNADANSDVSRHLYIYSLTLTLALRESENIYIFYKYRPRNIYTLHRRGKIGKKSFKI